MPSRFAIKYYVIASVRKIVYVASFLSVPTVRLFSRTPSFIYEAHFIHISRKTKRSDPDHITDVISLHNFKLGDFVDRIYPIVLEIKDTTDRAMSALYLEMHLEIYSEGRLRMKPYDKRYDYLFGIFKKYGTKISRFTVPLSYLQTLFSVIKCIYRIYCIYLL